MRLLVASLLLLATSEAAAGGSDGPRLQIHGFFLGAVGLRLADERPSSADDGLMLGEARLRLDAAFASPSDRTRFLFRGDFDIDAVAEDAGWDVRETCVAEKLGRLGLYAGRQIVTWGIGDLLFIDDVFPKDWESFFAGRPMEYLKLGVDALRGRLAIGGLAMDLIAVPTFTPDRLPTSDRFVFVDPLAGARIRDEEPRPGLGTAEWALRLQHKVRSASVSWHAYRGYWRAPAIRAHEPGAATRTYPDLSVVGVSVERALLGGLGGIEVGYYDSRQDRRGSDPVVPNSEARLLISYQLQPHGDMTLSFQIYGERMARYHAYEIALPVGVPREREGTSVASTRITWPLRYGTWTISCFAALHLEEGDSLVKPEVSHAISDSLSVTLGANIVSGASDATPFGWLSANDTAFASLRFQY